MKADADNVLRRVFLDAHKAAALTYSGLGIVVITLTFVAGLVPEGQNNPVLELSIGAFFIVIFAILIYRGWWPVSALLLASNSWRAFTYFNNGMGRHIELLPFSVTPIEPQPVAFVNAILMGVIVVMLARSAWIGFINWRGQSSPDAGSKDLDNRP